MGGAPVVVTVRSGVQFTPPAADAFRRLEQRLGRRVDVNSTYRDWDTQMGMYKAWNRYVNSGYKASLKPPHSRAIHPSISIHCQGNAMDSDDWRTPGFNALATEYGFIRTAASDPTEQHHYEYQSWRDQHRGEPAPAGGGSEQLEEDDMNETQNFKLDAVYRALVRDVGEGPFFMTDHLTGKVDAIKPVVTETYARVRGTDPRGDMLQLILEKLGLPITAEVDEGALARELAPLLPAYMGSLSDGDVDRLAKAAADEQAKRLAS
jgi:hypothetical protein